MSVVFVKWLQKLSLKFKKIQRKIFMKESVYFSSGSTAFHTFPQKFPN